MDDQQERIKRIDKIFSVIYIVTAVAYALACIYNLLVRDWSEAIVYGVNAVVFVLFLLNLNLLSLILISGLLIAFSFVLRYNAEDLWWLPLVLLGILWIFEAKNRQRQRRDQEEGDV